MSSPNRLPADPIEPTEDGDYIVTEWHAGKARRVRQANWDADDGWDGCTADKVLAWRPLPEPYKLPPVEERIITWIPVEVRLPTRDTADESNCVLMSWRSDGTTKWAAIRWDLVQTDARITHWASLKGALP